VKDIVSLSVTLLGFALLATSHVAIVVGLWRRATLARVVTGLFIVPLAPYWALRDEMPRRGTLWLLGLALYAGGLLAQL
jgi:hypothetical protein